MNMCNLSVLCESFDHMYIQTHVWWSRQWRGLKYCAQVYPKVDGALHMLCPCERDSHMIYVDEL